MADVRAVFGLNGPDLPADRVVVGMETFTVGRVAGNSLVLPNPRISRHHADITCHDGQFYIEDLESSNGTTVDGERIEARQPRLIKPGSSVQLGPFTLSFDRIESTDAALPPPPVSAEPVNTVDLGSVVREAALESVPPAPGPALGTPVITPVDVPNAMPPVINAVPDADVAPPEAVNRPAESVAPIPVSAPVEKNGKPAKLPRKPDESVPELPAEPAVYVSQLPASPSEAHTSPPIHTIAGDSASHNGEHKPDIQAVDLSAMLETLEPSFLPSRNGHSLLAPYVHIDGVSSPLKGSQYMDYLPGVFSDSDFLKRYLLIMESILAPLDWGVDSLEQYYNPLLTTPDWLQWIGEWFDVLIHPSLAVSRQRAVVSELGLLFRKRGTKAGLERLLELYFGVRPNIEELDTPPATFRVTLPLGADDTPLARALATRLITTCKPAYTAFILDIV